MVAVARRVSQAGGNCIDTALIYQGGESELVIGEWMRARGVEDEVVVLTKGAHPLRDGLPRVTTRRDQDDLEISLERLKVETIDLYLLHRDDPDVPVDEIVDCLNVSERRDGCEHLEAPIGACRDCRRRPTMLRPRTGAASRRAAPTSAWRRPTSPAGPAASASPERIWLGTGRARLLFRVVISSRRLFYGPFLT